MSPQVLTASVAELVPLWLAAVGTTVSSLIAAGALLWGRVDARRSYAEKVSVWFDGHAFARNAGELVVTDVHVRAYTETEPQPYGEAQATLHPGETWQAVPHEPPQELMEKLGRGEAWLQISFTDPAGRRWTRRSTGKLYREQSRAGE